MIVRIIWKECVFKQHISYSSISITLTLKVNIYIPPWYSLVNAGGPRNVGSTFWRPFLLKSVFETHGVHVIDPGGVLVGVERISHCFTSSMGISHPSQVIHDSDGSYLFPYEKLVMEVPHDFG